MAGAFSHALLVKSFKAAKSTLFDDIRSSVQPHCVFSLNICVKLKSHRLFAAPLSVPKLSNATPSFPNPMEQESGDMI